MGMFLVRVVGAKTLDMGMVVVVVLMGIVRGGVGVEDRGRRGEIGVGAS